MHRSVHPLLQPYLRQRRALLLDGGLATELENRGHDLSGKLWSAKLLHEEPEAIVEVHRAYLDAGADCLITASYQASVEGFRQLGLGPDAAQHLLTLSVHLAQRARDRHSPREDGQPKALVAASVGPYGATLANGSEYRGDDGLSEKQLDRFHRPRFTALREAGPDLMACETIPSGREARVLARLISESSSTPAWLSFSCRDGQHLADGSDLGSLARELEQTPGLIALGVNCVAPGLVDSLLRTLRANTRLPLVVYPNSGETWQARQRTWKPADRQRSWCEEAAAWSELGAQLIGGCCRTGPQQIQQLGAALERKSSTQG